MIMNINWYDRAKALMKEKRVTQDDLIAVLGVKTRGAVGHYLTGRREPNGEQLKQLADKLNISIDWLLTGKGEMRPATQTKPAPESNAVIEIRPPIIEALEWKAQSPKTRAFIEEILIKTSSQKLDDDDIRLLQDMTDKLSKK